MGVALVCFVIFILPDTALAAPTSATNTQQELVQKIVDALTLFMQFLQRLLWPVLLLIGGLMQNDILYGAGMEQTLLTIWQNIRNVVNILFVLFLLGIAFYNVMGGESQDYHIKTILPKFVLALIAVNFSFLIIKVLIDGVNVVSTAFFALPGAVSEGLTPDDQFQEKVCIQMYGNPTTNLEEYKEAVLLQPKELQFCSETEAKFNEDALKYFNDYNSNNAALAMAINMGQISELPKISAGTKDLSSLGINVIFAVVFYLVYAISFIVLFIVLLVRLVVLWILIVLSPLIVFMYVLPQNLKSIIGGADDLSSQFIKTAMVPIPIALVMSIGYIMLQSLENAKLTNFLQASTQGLGTLTTGLSTLQEIIVAAAMVGFVWVGIFTASKGTFADSIVDNIKSTAEGAGKFLATAPIKYAPILPVMDSSTGKDTGERMSIGGLMSAASAIPRSLDNKSTEEGNKLADMLGFGKSKFNKAMYNATNDKEATERMNGKKGKYGEKDSQVSFSDYLKKNQNTTGYKDIVKNHTFADKKKRTLEEFITELNSGKIDAKDLDAIIAKGQTQFDAKGVKTTDETAPTGATTGAAAGVAAGVAAGATTDDKGNITPAGVAQQKEVMGEGEEATNLALGQEAKTTLENAKTDEDIEKPEVQTALKNREAVVEEQKNTASQIATVTGKVASKDLKQQAVDKTLNDSRQRIAKKLAVQDGKNEDNWEDYGDQADLVLYSVVIKLDKDRQESGQAQRIKNSVESKHPEVKVKATSSSNPATPSSPAGTATPTTTTTQPESGGTPTPPPAGPAGTVPPGGTTPPTSPPTSPTTTPTGTT